MKPNNICKKPRPACAGRGVENSNVRYFDLEVDLASPPVVAPPVVAAAPTIVYRPVTPATYAAPTPYVPPTYVAQPYTVARPVVAAPMVATPVTVTRNRPILGGTVTRTYYRYQPAPVVAPVVVPAY